MKNTTITLLLLHLVLLGFAQEFRYDVRGTYKRSIIKERLLDVKTISDINPDYPSSWITGYISAEVVATCNGKVTSAVNTNDILSTEQINILKLADSGTDIVVNVKYKPKNSVDIKSTNFSFTVIPAVEAQYLGGQQALKQYLKENAIDKIPESIAKQIELASVRFAIDEEGQITDAQITQTSKDEKVDNFLLEAIRKMPKWKPAENLNGTKAKQEFEFTVGNFVGC